MTIASGLSAEDLVTGEAVALELPAAGLGSRILSGLIDVFATVVLLTLAAILARDLTAGSDEAISAAVLLSATVAALVGVPTAVETLTRGRSLGKVIVGLRTVRDDAGPISFRHALTRALVGFVEIWVAAGAPAVISALVSPRGKRLGDLAAGTFVVRDRMKLDLPDPVQLPPPLTGWAQQVDLGRVPDQWALSARQVIHRRYQLTPQAQMALVGELADEALRYLRPPPPPGTTPETIIIAVLAIRRERAAARLAEQARARRRWFPHSVGQP